MIRPSIFFLLLKFQFIICDLTRDQITTIDLPPKGFVSGKNYNCTNSHFPNSSPNLHVHIQGKFFVKLRYLEQCSDSGMTIDPVNTHKFKLSISKINEIDEGLNGYVVVNNYYRVTKVILFLLIKY